MKSMVASLAAAFGKSTFNYLLSRGEYGAPRASVPDPADRRSTQSAEAA